MRYLFVLAAVAAAALPVGADDPAKKALDPKALDVLKQATDFTLRAQTLHVEAALDTHLLLGEQKRETHATAVYDWARPNRFALRTRVDGNATVGPDVVCDGKVLARHPKRLKQYIETAAPDDLTVFGRVLQAFGPTANGMLFQNLLTDDPYDVLTIELTACSHEGKEKVDGTEAHHLKFVQPDLKWELWVAAEGKPLVLRVSSTQTFDGGSRTTVETYTNWRIDARPAKDAFTFTPVDGSKKVRVFRQGD